MLSSVGTIKVLNRLTAQMHRLFCAFVVSMQQNQVFWEQCPIYTVKPVLSGHSK